jgi:hypothetical protein
VASPVVEAVDMDLVDGDGKQQFTVEIRSLVDSICDKTGSVLSLFLLTWNNEAWKECASNNYWNKAFTE